MFLFTCNKASIWSFKIGLGTAPTRAVLTSRLESIKARWGMPSTRNLLTISAAQINRKRRNNSVTSNLIVYVRYWFNFNMRNLRMILTKFISWLWWWQWLHAPFLELDPSIVTKLILSLYWDSIDLILGAIALQLSHQSA